MSGAMSRRKGHRFERELAIAFRERMPGAKCKRGIQSRDGSDAPDVDVPGFWVEAKRGKKPNPRAALAQGIKANPGGRWTVAVVRDDRKPAFAVMPLDDLLDLIGEWWEAKQR